MQLLRKPTFYKIVLLLGMVCSMLFVFAGNGGGGGGNIVIKATLDGGLHQLKVDSARTVEDSAFYNPANVGNLDTAYLVQNVVTLKINEASPLYLRTAFHATVSIRIIYSNGSATDSIDRNFNIDYDSARVYNSRNSFVFNGGRRVTVKVLSVTSDVTSWDVASVLMVENQLTAKPKYAFSCSNTVANITITPSVDPASDELPVSWTTIRGADQYDLEWTYIARSALNNYKKAGGAFDPALIFYHNASRVTTTGTTYNIPLMYDDSGTVFIRVRAVQLGDRNAVIAATWSSDANPVIMGQYEYVGHERPLNWQSNISFAEEGKRKVVVQYYDGSLRNRQTVTKDNTTNKTIVAETYYDYQGRPVIQVMPAPSLSNIIQYTAGFNVSINGAEYSQSEFDSLPDPSQYCSIRANGMGIQSGASRYYSPNNPNKTQGLNQFIPDAKNYPFTETEYTPDNTGRISRQSGVGPDHQLGTGHETKYYYSTPDQNELDALFGTEVGDKSHYFKNMVRDANGQYSVSYVDMHGRTIATALAGAAPAGMAPLASNSTKTVTETLADAGSNYINGNSMISQKTLLVTNAGTYQFNYRLTPETLTDKNCDQQNICYTCLYDVRVTITDNCNNQLLPGAKSFDTVLHNFSFGSIPVSCEETSPVSLDFSLFLQEGSYSVTKTLTVNQDAYVYYRDSVYLPNNTCKSIQQFIDEQKAIIATSTTSCITTCSACRSSVGTFETYRTKFIEQSGIAITDTAAFREDIAAAYKNALEGCAALCGDSSSIDNDIRAAMLQDMTPPYGQYADTANRKGDIHSIFYVPPYLDENAKYTPAFQLKDIVYRDENGRTDSVYNLSSDLMVLPRTLSMEQFVQNFRTSWAEALLPYHPEYCKLLVLESLKSSNLWDRRMEAIDSYHDAKVGGYLNPTGNGSFGFPIVNANIDPFSTRSTGSKTDLENKLRVYLKGAAGRPDLSLWGMACLLVKCDSGNAACVTYYTNSAHYFDENNMCEGDLDMAWRNFRQMYLGAKQELVNKIVNNPTGCTPANPAYTTVPKVEALFSDHHTPRFTNDINNTVANSGLDYLTKGAANSTEAQKSVNNTKNQMTAFYAQNAKAYVQQWAQQLSPCNYPLDHLRDTILPRLEALCLMASDAEHLFGASTLPKGKTYTPAGTSYVFTSFRDIINAYNVVHGITASSGCNPEMITAPQPYDKQPVYVNKPVYSRPSDCECSQISNLYNTYLLSRHGDVSFAAYLKRTQGITISTEDLNTLRNLCNDNPGGASGEKCTYLSQPVYLPPSMQCNSGEVCASCILVDSLYHDYIVAYPADTPRVSDIDDTTQIKSNVLFQNYMNNRLGFGLLAWQYLQFMDSCAVHEGDISHSTECMDKKVGNIFLTAGSGQLNDIRTITGNGYILAGSAGITGNRNATLVKTDQSGTVQWAKTYGGNNDDVFTRVKSTDDGGYIAVGTTHSGRYTQGAILVVKTDGSGAAQWTKTIGFNTTAGEQGYDIVQTLDGGYAALGIFNQHAGNGEFLLARLSSTGIISWVNRFGTSRLQSTNCSPADVDTMSYNGSPSYSILQHQDTLMIAGAAYDRNIGDRYFGVIYNVDENSGDLLSSWHYADSLNLNASTWFRDIYATPNGYTVSAVNAKNYGTDSAQAAVIQLSRTGAVQSYKRLDVPAGNNRMVSSALFPTNDGGYIVAQTGNGTAHINWQRMNAAGNLLWATETILPGSQVIGKLVQMGDTLFTAVGANNGKALMINLRPATPAACYDNMVSLGASDRLLSRINWAAEGTEALMPLHTDTSFTVAALSITDSALVCPGNGNCYTIYNGPLLCGKSQPLLPPVAVDSITACSDSTFFAVSKGTELYKVYKDSLTGSFEQRYLSTCMNAYKHESFTVTHSQNEYHYTLYYYDQAGNLARTVPPAGVQDNRDAGWLADVKTARIAGDTLTPRHTLLTQYRYNTLNQIVAQISPDGGLSHFWYDRLGRLVISQNAKQQPNNQYSYTNYDTIGRITQAGQLTSSTAITNAISRNQYDLAQWLTNAAATREQITQTTYDNAYSPVQPILAAKNLRSRVSWMAIFNNAADLVANEAASATYYSYDVLGNVDTLLQDYKKGVMADNGNRFKKTVYEFDLISGKTNFIAYQPGHPDAFYHKYLYDAENRITHVLTSKDSLNWDNDAFYTYYDHGPLARTILGEQQVQGINYSYNLQGWMKAINPAVYNGGGYNLKQDGSNGSVVAANAYNLLLNYYGGDYAAICSATPEDAGLSTTLGSDYRPLYNGNISSMGVNIKKLDNPLLYNYQYDQLNRLIAMDAWHKTGTSWSNSTLLQDFKERISYDANGNILQYLRNGNNSFAGSPLAMDSLHYTYKSGTNQLDHVTDEVAAGNYSNDIDNQVAGNYSYDVIGNMTADNAEHISSIEWNVYGKITRINKINDTSIVYTYDATGNRNSKQLIVGTDTITTWYVRDAQGNVLSVYHAGIDSVNDGHLSQRELHLYGSGRLGILRTSLDVAIEPISTDTALPLLGSGYALIFARGNKLFELSNHLGNVLVTLSDKKLGQSDDDSLVAYFTPEIISAQDYYPFGMLQPGRSYNVSDYRYGFNGKENDNEVKGEGNQQDYGMRIYDLRLGKFLSVDPVTMKYPDLTPYQFSSNRPIDGVDLDGLEFYNSNSARVAIGLIFDPKIKKITSFTTYFRSENLPDALNTAIEQANTCSNCIGSSAANVASFKLNILNPFIKTELDIEPKDIDVPENSAVGPSAAASQIMIVPKNKKEARAQEKSRTYFTEGGAARIAKVGAVMAAVDIAATVVQSLGIENLKSIVQTAKNQSLSGAPEVVGIIQKAIDAGKLNGYLDQGSLVGLANYLLYGAKITKYEVVKGEGSYVEDLELTKAAKQLWLDYIIPLNEKKIQETLKQERKQRVDNVGTNNHSGL